MADYKLWNALKDAKKYRWVELSHSLNNESPYWSGIPEGSVELAKTVWDWGKPELECLIQTFKFPGQFGTHIDFPGHFIKGKSAFSSARCPPPSPRQFVHRRCFPINSLRCLSFEFT